MTRLLRSIAVVSVSAIVFMAAPSVAVTGQTRLDPSTLTKYLDPLPAPARLDGTVAQTMTMSEFTQQVLPSNFRAGPYGGKTLVWGYNNSYPGPTIVARRGTPFRVTWTNNLVNPALLPDLPYDQTLDWADPLGCNGAYACSGQRYTGPVPTVTHFHGGEVPSAFDGHPDTWFTSGYQYVGPDWVAQTYTYPNAQEASTFWYHDHTLGVTRLNVYAGLAGFYLLRDPNNEPANLPSGSYEREIVFQDRSFDINGQLMYPDNGDGGHPFWVKEFFGDVSVVNGKVWPYLNVEPRRYRFRMLNGSSTRTYTIQIQTTSGAAGPPVWQIGTDGGLLNNPIQITSISIAPGERVDAVVDFTGKSGVSFLLKNGDGSRSTWGSTSLSELMKINVSLPLNGSDTSLVPTATTNLRPNNPIVRLSSTVTSSTLRRNMTLERDRSGGGFLLNGKHFHDTVTEKPRVGSTEVWTLDNRTGDMHPIHLHLTEFQVYQDGGGYHDGWSGGGGWGSSTSGTDPNDVGWKDTIQVPGWSTVSIVVRWAPLNTPAGGVQPGQNLFPFNPTATLGTIDGFGYPGGPGYVWHCHRIEHEDNEMMRPFQVVP